MRAKTSSLSIIVRRGERHAESLHEPLPGASHAVHTQHPNERAHARLRTKVNCGKELGKQIRTEVLVEGNNGTNAKLINKVSGLLKVLRMRNHVLKTDRFHIWNKGILPVLGDHVIHFLLTLVPELGTNQGGILFFTIWVGLAVEPVLRYGK